MYFRIRYSVTIKYYSLYFAVECLSLPQCAASCPVGAAGVNKRPEHEAVQYRRLRMHGAVIHTSHILLQGC